VFGIYKLNIKQTTYCSRFKSGRRHPCCGSNHNHRTALRFTRFRREIVGRFEPVTARDLALACVSRDSTRASMVKSRSRVDVKRRLFVGTNHINPTVGVSSGVDYDFTANREVNLVPHTRRYDADVHERRDELNRTSSNGYDGHLSETRTDDALTRYTHPPPTT
jgi:hypothetical protein